jgi:hypothetical protein
MLTFRGDASLVGTLVDVKIEGATAFGLSGAATTNLAC